MPSAASVLQSAARGRRSRTKPKFPPFCCFALLKKVVRLSKNFVHKAQHSRVCRSRRSITFYGEDTSAFFSSVLEIQKRSINYQTHGDRITNRVQSAFDLGHILSAQIEQEHMMYWGIPTLTFPAQRIRQQFCHRITFTSLFLRLRALPAATIYHRVFTPTWIILRPL